MIRSMPTNDNFRNHFDETFRRSNAGLVQLEERQSCKLVAESSNLSSGPKMIIKCQDEDIILNGS